MATDQPRVSSTVSAEAQSLAVSVIFAQPFGGFTNTYTAPRSSPVRSGPMVTPGAPTTTVLPLAATENPPNHRASHRRRSAGQVVSKGRSQRGIELPFPKLSPAIAHPATQATLAVEYRWRRQRSARYSGAPPADLERSASSQSCPHRPQPSNLPRVPMRLSTAGHRPRLAVHELLGLALALAARSHTIQSTARVGIPLGSGSLVEWLGPPL